ncbi:hypothetical protein, partial [Limnobacter sp.]|uniref:hypothetical protein n=1 Tax=Limnobacter sp. TaxID=2003368 RepID=UPI002FE18DD6
NVNYTDLIENSVTLKRILTIEDDPSKQARFGSTENIEYDLHFLFGHGLDTTNFQSIAANGLAFLIYSFGIFGTLMLSGMTVYLSQTKLSTLVIVAFSLTTFPMFSYMFYWVFLAWIISGSNNRATTFHLQQSQPSKSYKIIS